jgi:hypothetical protein
MEDETKYVESPHSVKIAINAKGQFSAECKCYGVTPEDAMKKTSQLAAQLEQLIKEKNASF